MKEYLSQFYKRDLQSLKNELLAYTNEADLWLVDKHINNSAGNLTLHLIGNLNHFIGAVLGETGFVRDRESEFSQKNIPRTLLLEEINATIQMIEDVLGKISSQKFSEPYPIEVLNKKWQADEFLIHLAIHLSYHLGQVNYHRRLLFN